MNSVELTEHASKIKEYHKELTLLIEKITEEQKAKHPYGDRKEEVRKAFESATTYLRKELLNEIADKILS